MPMISRTFRTPTPNSSLPIRKVKYFPARSSTRMEVAASVVTVVVDCMFLLVARLIPPPKSFIDEFAIFLTFPFEMRGLRASTQSFLLTAAAFFDVINSVKGERSYAIKSWSGLYGPWKGRDPVDRLPQACT